MSRRFFAALASVLVLASPAASKSHHVEQGVVTVPHHQLHSSARESRRTDARRYPGRMNAQDRVVAPDPYAVDRRLREQAVRTFFSNGPTIDGFGCNYNPLSAAEGFCLPR